LIPTVGAFCRFLPLSEFLKMTYPFPPRDYGFTTFSLLLFSSWHCDFFFFFRCRFLPTHHEFFVNPTPCTSPPSHIHGGLSPYLLYRVLLPPQSSSKFFPFLCFVSVCVGTGQLFEAVPFLYLDQTHLCFFRFRSATAPFALFFEPGFFFFPRPPVSCPPWSFLFLVFLWLQPPSAPFLTSWLPCS